MNLQKQTDRAAAGAQLSKYAGTAKERAVEQWPNLWAQQ